MWFVESATLLNLLGRIGTIVQNKLDQNYKIIETQRPMYDNEYASIAVITT